MPSLVEDEPTGIDAQVSEERRFKLKLLGLGNLLKIALASGATQGDLEVTEDTDDLIELIMSLEEIPKESGPRPHIKPCHTELAFGNRGTQSWRSGPGQNSIDSNHWNSRRDACRTPLGCSPSAKYGQSRSTASSEDPKTPVGGIGLHDMRIVIRTELKHSLKLFGEELRLLFAEALKGASMATHSKPRSETFSGSVQHLPNFRDFTDLAELGRAHDWGERFSSPEPSLRDVGSPFSAEKPSHPQFHLSASAKTFGCRSSGTLNYDIAEEAGKQRLFSAVAQNNFDEVEELLEKGAQPNAVLAKYTKKGASREYLDCSLLAVAVMADNIDIVRLLVNFGASLESRYGFLAGSLQMPWSGTAIFAAMPRGNVEMVRELVDLEADPHQCSTNRANLVWQACYFGHTQILVYLLHLGVEHRIAAQNQDFEGVSHTPLHIAAIRDHLGVMEKLISAKANIDSVNEEGKTPLLYAIAQKHAASVRRLVAAGANLVKDNVKSDQIAVRPLDILLQMSNNVLLHSVAVGLRDQENQVAKLKVPDLLEFLASPLSRKEILHCLFKRRKLQYWVAVDGIMEVEAAYLRKPLILHGGQTHKFLNVACAKHDHATMESNVKKRCEPDSDTASFLKTLAPQTKHSRWISPFSLEKHSMMAIHTHEAVLPNFHLDLRVLKVISDASAYETFFNGRGCQAILQNAWNDVWHFSLFYGMMSLGLLVVFVVLAALWHMRCWDNKSCKKETLGRAVIIVAAAGVPFWSAQVVRELLIIVAHIRYGWIASLFRRRVTYYNFSIAAADGLILVASLNHDGHHELDFTMRLLFSISCLDKWMRCIYEATIVRKFGLPVMPILFTLSDIGPFAILFCTYIAAFTTALFALDLKHELWIDTFVSVFLFGSVAEPEFMQYAAHPSHGNETSRILLRLIFAASTFFVAITMMNCFIAAMTASYKIGSNNKQKLYQSRLAHEVWRNMAARRTWWTLRRNLLCRTKSRNKRDCSHFLWYAVEIDE